MNVVVCSIGGRHAAGELPESRFTERPRWAGGGERSLYELATAAAVAGFDVELRGAIHEPAYTEITRHAVGASPRVGLPARPPTEDDLVIVPEGLRSLKTLASVCFSPARLVMMLLGPPGLWGPSFLPGWEPPEWLTIPPDSVGTPEQFQAIASLGFEMWSNSPRMTPAAAEGACSCLYLGTGTPVPFPEPPSERPHDVVLVTANRWVPLAWELAERAGVTPHAIPEVFNSTVAAELAQGRILLWPSRIEGACRIQREARAVGTVPVALSSNVYAAQLDAADRAVVVDTLDEMAEQVRRLREDHAAWRTLSERGMASARAQSDWDAHVGRVHDALVATRDRPATSTAARVLGTSHVTAIEQRCAEQMNGKEAELDESRRLVDAYRRRRAIRTADAVRRFLDGVQHRRG